MLENHSNPDTEAMTGAKWASIKSLLWGQRARQFDALLPALPTSDQLGWLSLHLQKPYIESVIFDVDGTLVPPYASIHDEVMDLLNGYLKDGRKVGIYTNSPYSDRLDVFKKAGIPIAGHGIGKPELEGFSRFCTEEHMRPESTAMIGNFPITDAPYVPEGSDPFFPVNVLVESIPPRRDLVPSLRKYIRASIFHLINVASAQVVLARNPEIVRSIN